MFRKLQCLQQPNVSVDVAGVAFDHAAVASLQDLDPFFKLCCGSTSNFGNADPEKIIESFDIPVTNSINEASFTAPSNSLFVQPTRHSRISAGAIMVFIIEALMLVLFDVQLLPFQAVAPRFWYFWVAQVVVASISLIFFTCCMCAHHWHFVIEAFIVGIGLFTNAFIIVCAAMVIASYSFTDFQIYVIRMSFLASRSFNCFACIVSARKQLFKLIHMCTCNNRIESKKEVQSKSPQTPASKSPQTPASTAPRITKLEPASFTVANVPVGPNILQQRSAPSMLNHVTNRITLVECSLNRQEYFACKNELLRISQPQNRLLVSLGNIWSEAAPEAFHILTEVSLGGHVDVDCASDGCCGLVEFFDVCSTVCKWLQSDNSHTVAIFHKGSRSCAGMLCCGILMATGLSPRCEHALHLVLLSSMLPVVHEVGQLTSVNQRCMVRFFDCFSRAEQHPIRAVPRFLAMIVLNGCVVLPPGFEISVDVICSGLIRVKSGQMVKPSQGEFISREIDCKFSSANTLHFTFEINSVFCRGDIEVAFLVKNTGNGAAAKIASVRSHSSFCGISEPHILRYNAVDVDWLGGNKAMPRFFTGVELHFGSIRTSASDELTASIFSGQLAHFNRPAFKSNVFLSALLSKGSQLQVLTGANMVTESSLSSNRSPSVIIVLNGACSVELMCPSVPKSATCVLPGVSSGQMLPSLQVTNRHTCMYANKLTIV